MKRWVVIRYGLWHREVPVSRHWTLWGAERAARRGNVGLDYERFTVRPIDRKDRR